VSLLQARVDNDLKLRHRDDLARRHSSSDDVQLRNNRRHRLRHDDEGDISVSRTRRERAKLGLRDKLDELRLQDDLRHSTTSSDVTMTPPRRSTSPGLMTSLRKEVEKASAAAGAGGCDEKPVCTVKSSLNDKDVEMMTSQSSSLMTSQSSSLSTSHWCPAADAARARLCTPGIAVIIAYHRTHRHRRQNGSHAANVFLDDCLHESQTRFKTLFFKFHM